ncbi:aminotransferase class IV [Microlunatus parietis]|uniref:Branched-subunit amino acid aminotransferase/4-amino-4-deoxychorismate lyase n=1 Tax=Microlunatus parietis TaxID=682979 RepID=A0A7Y9I862_9ACTN|nr:aminotransferase class IV [Microlunatus parietis]NYE71992.1 branched-subunit amino acid aminotransferase/4-amino-4-deoxychorismate lyase [Microlunatus parietis]
MAVLNGEPATRDQLAALALINYGHFTSMLAENGLIKGLTAHCDRLTRDCRRLFGVDLPAERVREYLRPVVAEPGTRMVRVTVFDPAADLLHPDGEPAVLITTRPAGKSPLPPLRLRTVPVRRELPEVKHVGLFGTLWARREARQAGADDALLIDRTMITEGPSWNVGFVRDHEIVWPAAAVLPGVTQLLLQAAGPASVTQPVRVDELGGFAAAFATNSGFGVRPIAAIDDDGFDHDHPVLRRLSEAYAAIPGEAP